VTDLAVGVLLALGSACCYALAATLQHDAVTTVTGGAALTARRLGQVLRRRRWLLGVLTTACGGLVHATALSRAPLVVVQPIGVVAIGLTVVLAAVVGRVPLDRTSVAGALVSTAGIGGFVLIAASRSTEVPGPPSPPATALLVPVVAVLVLVAIGRGVRGAVRGPLFACAAGVSYGTVSMLTRSLATHLRSDGWHGLGAAPVMGLVVGILGGLWCAQQAYGSGRPATAVACQSVTDPLTGVLLGTWLYGETSGWTAPTLISELGCGAVTVLGVVLLVRAHAPQMRPRDVGSPSCRTAV
jgi:hypothetical protein